MPALRGREPWAAGWKSELHVLSLPSSSTHGVGVLLCLCFCPCGELGVAEGPLPGPWWHLDPEPPSPWEESVSRWQHQALPCTPGGLASLTGVLQILQHLLQRIVPDSHCNSSKGTGLAAMTPLLDRSGAHDLKGHPGGLGSGWDSCWSLAQAQDFSSPCYPAPGQPGCLRASARSAGGLLGGITQHVCLPLS